MKKTANTHTPKPASAGIKTSPAPLPDTTPAKPPRAENDRLTIPLDKDGRPDFASMRDKTRERVRKVISDPAVARELGITPDAAPAAKVLPRELTMAAVTMISQLETIIIARVTKAPAAIVLAVAPYTPEEKELIAPALENVLNKYSPAVLNKWSDEIALTVLLSTLTMRKIEAVRAAAGASGPARGPAPVIQHPSAPAPAAPASEPEPVAQLDPEVIQ
jgi:hypothetical protein